MNISGTKPCVLSDPKVVLCDPGQRGLLTSDADKADLKETISRIARIRKEGDVSVVVLL